MKETLYLKEWLVLGAENWPYEQLEKAYETGLEGCLAELETSGLLGRGGAGFPTAKKWRMVDGKEQVVLICNGDEGEPGTFKDRYILENNPAMLLEGILIAAYMLRAHEVYVYIRGEYATALKQMKKAIDHADNIINRFRMVTGINLSVQLVKGQGAYVCGDETSLINSIEGLRPNSRMKPPYPTESGLRGLPTVVNNVETLCNIPRIIGEGGQSFAALGVEGSRGTKLVCLSGKVANPGVYEIELGKVSLRELIWDIGGGIAGGKAFKFVIPGGISTPLLLDEALDTPFDYKSVRAAGSSLGSGAVIVADETVSVVETACSVADFYMKETCGICFPCREGNRQIEHLLKRIKAGRGESRYLELICDISQTTSLAARCGLGQSAGNFIESAISKFENEFDSYMQAHKQSGGELK